jgi:hypothetical protein
MNKLFLNNKNNKRKLFLKQKSDEMMNEEQRIKQREKITAS